MLASSVPVIGWFFKIHPTVRRPHRDLEPSAIAPGRTFVARGRQTDGLRRPMLCERSFVNWQRVDEDHVAADSQDIAVALEIDAIVMHGVPIHPLADLPGKRGESTGFRHGYLGGLTLNG